MAWYHPDEAVAPHVGGARVRRSSTAASDWSTLDHASTTRSTPRAQELAENGVDSAHFRYVHNTAEVPELDAYETDGSRWPSCGRRRSSRRPAAWSRVASTRPLRPGLSIHRASAASSTRCTWAATRPIDADRCQLRFNFRVRDLGDDGTT